MKQVILLFCFKAIKYMNRESSIYKRASELSLLSKSLSLNIVHTEMINDSCLYGQKNAKEEKK